MKENVIKAIKLMQKNKSMETGQGKHAKSHNANIKKLVVFKKPVVFRFSNVSIYVCSKENVYIKMHVL